MYGVICIAEYQGEFVRVAEEQVNGQRYERVYLHDCVTVVLRCGDKYVLIREHRPEKEQTVLKFPSGLVEPGEDPQETAVRELREETGLAGRDLRLVTSVRHQGTINRSKYYYLASVDGIEEAELEEGVRSLVTVSEEELFEMLFNGHFSGSDVVHALVLLYGERYF